MRPIKIVVDTNVWISVLIGKRLSALKPLLDNGNVRLVFSETLQKELDNVINRPKFRKYFTPEVANGTIGVFLRQSENVPDSYAPSRCRDSKDDYLQELALQSNADFLVTGDDDLLSLQKIGKTTILSVAEFQKVLEVV